MQALQKIQGHANLTIYTSPSYVCIIVREEIATLLDQQSPKWKNSARIKGLKNYLVMAGAVLHPTRITFEQIKEQKYSADILSKLVSSAESTFKAATITIKLHSFLWV